MKESDIKNTYEIVYSIYEMENNKQANLDSKLAQLMGINGVLISLALAIIGILVSESNILFLKNADFFTLLFGLCVALFVLSSFVVGLGIWPRKFSEFSLETLQVWIDKEKNVNAELVRSWLVFAQNNRAINRDKGRLVVLAFMLTTSGIILFGVIAIFMIVRL